MIRQEVSTWFKDSKVFTHGLPSGPRTMPFGRDFLVVAAAVG